MYRCDYFMTETGYTKVKIMKKGVGIVANERGPAEAQHRRYHQGLCR